MAPDAELFAEDSRLPDDDAAWVHPVSRGVAPTPISTEVVGRIIREDYIPAFRFALGRSGSPFGSAAYVNEWAKRLDDAIERARQRVRSFIVRWVDRRNRVADALRLATDRPMRHH